VPGIGRTAGFAGAGDDEAAAETAASIRRPTVNGTVVLRSTLILLFFFFFFFCFVWFFFFSFSQHARRGRRDFRSTFPWKSPKQRLVALTLSQGFFSTLADVPRNTLAPWGIYNVRDMIALSLSKILYTRESSRRKQPFRFAEMIFKGRRIRHRGSSASRARAARRL